MIRIVENVGYFAKNWIPAFELRPERLRQLLDSILLFVANVGGQTNFILEL
jgi:hypothetical protein